MKAFPMAVIPVLFIVVCLLQGCKPGPTTIYGKAEIAGRPAPGARIVLSGGGQDLETVANSDGEYAFENVPPGSYTVRIAGYSTGGFVIGDSTSIRVRGGRRRVNLSD